MSDDRVYGIDLGTTYTCIAYVDEMSGRPTITMNSEGDLTTASAVFFETAETRVIGHEAKSAAITDPDKVVEMVKRSMGVPNWRREFFGKDYSAEEISAYILRKVVDDAEQATDVRPHKVVITCPAYFDSPRREATASAGRIAGLEVLEVINEPTAAAIAYGLHDSDDQTVLIYDLGGGTFDVTVITIKGGAITVVATDGNHELGGRDWDERVVQFLAEQWRAGNPDGSDPVDNPETVQDLWTKAESAKRALSGKIETRVNVVHEAKLTPVTLTREKFAELTADLLERTVGFTKKVIETAGELGAPKIDKMLLVGGSTRMPQVAARLHQDYGFEIKPYEPELAVAKGAAIYGQKLAIGERIRIEIGKRLAQDADSVDVAAAPAEVRAAAEEAVAEDMQLRIGVVQRLSNMQVTNVISHSFGVKAVARDDKSVIANLIQAQQQLPAEAKQTFGTYASGMSLVALEIFENTVRAPIVEDFSTADEVGKAVLELATGLPANSPIEVTFRFSNEGRLEIT
ncbi:Hsp70 family protein, partial [Actinoplanes sp. NPDC051633]|uniref:Hsp70 family protein n=1 Tax=Actinoplanes sp. NPDC051633 TaxID=3155670 RepID=UPI003426560C